MESIEHKRVEVNGINMHVAEKGHGPLILFIHGYPELWYSWRHQIIALSSLGYRAVAPDLRGYGETDAPSSITSYTCFHHVGDLISLLDVLAPDQDKVYVVGHDWGALIAWYLCMFRPDRVKALVNLSVLLLPRIPKIKPLQAFRSAYGDDFYICRFQKPGEIEAEFAEIGTKQVLKGFFTLGPEPLVLPKGKFFRDPISPSWLSEEDLNYYTKNFDKTGFNGPVNYYRCLDLNWELTASWTENTIEVPTKFIIGDLDLTYDFLEMKEYTDSGKYRNNVPFLKEAVVMRGVGHFINQEKAEEINKHIYDFFKKF